MALAALYNVPLTPEEHQQWSFAHAAHHADIIAVINQLTGIMLPQYILDPFNPDDEGSMQLWLAQHQTMHQNMDALLNISPYDLSDVEWKNPEELSAWIQLNADEHRQAGDLLGVA